MDASLIFGLVLGSIGTFLYLKQQWKYGRLPPGPKGLPFVGNVFQQNPEKPYITWSVWAKEFGDVFTIWNFGKPVVLCNRFDALWEMFVIKSNDFSGRPQDNVGAYLLDNGNDINKADFTPGWARRKKVFMKSLKMYGEGMKHIEGIMVDIITELLEEIDATKQQPFDPQVYLELTLVNILSLLLLGRKFEKKEDDFCQLVKYAADVKRLTSLSIQTFIYDALPWLRYFPLPHSRAMKGFVSGIIKNWIPRQIENVKAHYDRNNCVCVMDAFLKQLEIDEETGEKHPIRNRHIVAMTEDFLLAGIVTSSSTLYTLFAILTAKPEIQDKVREELDRVLQGQRPTLEDKENMPYFLAMLEEVWRYAVIVPGAPHKATKDSTLCGHFIPKDTEVVPNIWSLCHDENVWSESFVFRPERFLDNDGKFLPADHPKRKCVLVFGAGRRVCAAQQLARNRIFLIVTSLLQRFIFKPASENQLTLYDPHLFKFGSTIMPQPYQLRAVPRN